MHLLVAARSERYNHDFEMEDDTEEDTDDPMFHSFSSCSPRLSRVFQTPEELQEVES